MAKRVKPWVRGRGGRFVPSRVVIPVKLPARRVGVSPRLVNKSYPIRPVSSTNIEAVGYIKITAETGRLYVDFLSGKSAVYYEVPFEDYQGFMDAPSKGRFFHFRIRKGGYRWEYV